MTVLSYSAVGDGNSILFWQIIGPIAIVLGIIFLFFGFFLLWWYNKHKREEEEERKRRLHGQHPPSTLPYTAAWAAQPNAERHYDHQVGVGELIWKISLVVVFVFVTKIN